MANWKYCEHVWYILEDSQFHNEYELDVRCIKCECPGAKNIKTGDVFWPAT